MSSDSDVLQLAAQAIGRADALLIAAGAGMGVDSGLPDFRGNEGFWKAYPPLKKLGLLFAQAANPYWFHSNPEQRQIGIALGALDALARIAGLLEAMPRCATAH